MKRAATLDFGSLPSYRLGLETYDPDKIGLGELMMQESGLDSFIGPLKTRVARPMEASTAVPGVFPWAMKWKNDIVDQIDWVFLADNATAAATRRIVAYKYDRKQAEWFWQGTITVTFPVATVITIRGLRMTYDKYSTGTVAVAATAVTGTGTAWNANACVGNRIGFGSTDPTQITTWYEISARASDTGITLATAAGTIAGGTPYVIEDLRAIISTTNATATNGGLFVCKGLNWDRFSSIAGTVPAATTVDNIRACYWLADNATVTNITATGLALDTRVDAVTQDCYVIDGTANPVVFKYNVRAALTLTAGKATNAFLLKTGSGGAVTGAIGQNNNSRLATAAHGPHSGIKTLYFTTASRIYAVPISAITNASTTFLSAGTLATEVPPGGVNTFGATGGMSGIEYMGSIDQFAVVTGAASKSYVTNYRTDGGQFGRVFGTDLRQIDQGAADSTIVPVLSMSGGAFTIWCEDGIGYIAIFGTTVATNRLYAVPLGADWEYVGLTNSYIITPKILCPDASNLQKVFTNAERVLGGATGANLGMSTEAFRVKYRSSGISDNSGGWSDVSELGDISGAATEIQLRFEFRTIGITCLPARIKNVAIIYEDSSTDSRYQFSGTNSDAVNKRFAWRHSTAFGGAVPNLTVRLYDAVTGSLLLTDDSTTPTLGTFQRSTDGGAGWSAFATTDKGNETTYIRYTPTTLADNISVRPVLTVG